MNKTLGFLLISCAAACGTGTPGERGPAGEAGFPGDKGDRGDKGDKGDKGTVQPALTVVDPTSAFSGRSLVVQIAGAGAHFDMKSTVDFGDPGVKVTKLEMGGNNSLRAYLEISLDAKLGAHDVKVNSPAPPAGDGNPEMLVLKGGFMVSAPLQLEPPAMGMPAMVPQGGILDLSAKNLDYRDNPLYPSKTQLIGGITPLSDTSATVSEAHFADYGLVDALAPAGAVSMLLSTTNPLGAEVRYVSDPMDKAAPTVTARMATELKAGMTKTGEALTAARQTNLYKLTTTADNQVLLLSAANLGAAYKQASGTTRLIGSMAPASGKFHDGVAYKSSSAVDMMGAATSMNSVLLLPKMGDFFFAVYSSDLSGGAMDHGYDLTATVATGAAMPTLKEPMMPDSEMKPLADIPMLDKPYFGIDGKIDVTYEDDFITFTPSKTGRIYVTASYDKGAYLGLGLRKADCLTYVVSSVYGSGSVSLEGDVTMGTQYCIKVLGYSDLTSYQLVVTQ